MNSPHRMIRALLRQPVDTVPVWMMRQAGRYLPEYLALRKKVPDFVAFCKTPELVCEAALQPLRRFDLDSAIVFSDILTVVDALGFHLEFMSGRGPVVHNPVRSMDDVIGPQATPIEVAIEKLDYVSTAIQWTTQALGGKWPLIGFAGSPWTVGCYMIEGYNNTVFSAVRTMQIERPEIVHQLMEKLTQLTIGYLNHQIHAGADAVMIFDSWGGLLPTQKAYVEFSLQYMQKIAENLTRTLNGKTIPVIFFTKQQPASWLEPMLHAGCDAIGLGASITMAEATAIVNGRLALQGNLDLAALHDRPASAVRAAVQQIIYDHGLPTGHVFNLANGIEPHTSIDHIETIIAAVRQYGKMHVC